MSVLERVREQEALVTEGAATFRSAVGDRDRLKRKLVDRLGLATMATMIASEDVTLARRELAVVCQALLNTQEFEGLTAEECASLTERVLDEVCGLGPIQRLLDDEEVTEIMINGCDALLFERGGRIQRSSVAFETPEQILMVLDRILAPLGRRLDMASPIVNARLANGDRVNAVAPPVALNGPAVTIRKFSNRIASLDVLVGLGALPSWYAQLLTWAVRMRQDIAVAGGTGSGKTTLLNALSTEIDPSERIITIEDSAELRFDTHPDVVRLEARDASIEGTGEISIRDLVKNALRMRPDRIVVGEVRGGETIDMLQAMNTGHDGSLTTLHAGSAEEAVLRLVLMARFGMDLPTSIIEEQVATALDLLVMSQRLVSGERRITSLSAVRRGEGGTVELTDCVTYDAAEDEWTLVCEPRFVQEAVRSGQLEESEVEAWRVSLF